MNKFSLKPLSDLKVGEVGIVNKFCENNDIHSRLLNIGLIEGTKVSCVFKNPSGDPSAFLIRGAVIALRSDDCRCVLMEV